MSSVREIRPDTGWTEDWRGTRAVILGSGPSTGDAHRDGRLARLRAARDASGGTIRVITLNETLELFPDPDLHYACDAKWWAMTGQNWRALDAIKVCAEPGAHAEHGVRRVVVQGDEMRFDHLFCLGGGGNSGFQALNLLAQVGVASVALMGLDMGGGGITHWHGPGWPFGGGGTLPQEVVDRWFRATQGATPALKARGVKVINVSPISALTAYPKRNLDDVLSEWCVTGMAGAA